jgi:hypothetical protein
MLIIVYILYKQHGNDLNQQGFNLIGFIATVLVLTLFGSSFGTCFRYYIREKFASFIVMVGTLIYTILFSVLGQIYITDHFLFVTLYFNVLPIAIFAPIAIATTVLGFYLMKHSNVDV